MALGIIPALNEVLRNLPPDSWEAQRLQFVIRVLEDALPLSANGENSKLREELASERKKREDAETALARCAAELNTLKSSTGSR